MQLENGNVLVVRVLDLEAILLDMVLRPLLKLLPGHNFLEGHHEGLHILFSGDFRNVDHLRAEHGGRATDQPE
jgi:hypothetical protein